MARQRKALNVQKGAIITETSGVRVKTHKKDKTSIRSIIYVDPIFMSLARKDIDLAIEGLTCLNQFEFEPNDSLKEKFFYAQYLCKYTRYCHLTTWKFEISIERAENPVLEELKMAEHIIDELIKHNQWKKDDLDLLKRIHNNIKARIYNIKERYCKGLNTLFDFDEIWPGKRIKKLQSKKVTLKV